MFSRSAFLKWKLVIRSGLALCLAAQIACLPEVKELCRLVTDPTAAPRLPADLAQLDALLLRRANEMTLAARELKRFVVWDFRVAFAGQSLPILCEKLERARELAAAGRTAEAGRKYQALLVATQVLQMDVAVHVMAQYADAAGQADGQVTVTLGTFERQMRPVFEAALSEDPERIAKALSEHPEAFRTWVEYLEQWPRQVEVGVERVKTAKLIWDTTFLVIATYEAAVAAAEIVAAGGPPMPPLPALAPGGAAAAAGFSPAASLELAEAIRRLVAAGALDAGVVVALSKTLGGQGAPVSRPTAPTMSQMSQGPKEAVPFVPKGASAPPRLTIPEGDARYGLEHILKRHAFGTLSKKVSKFAQGMGANEIRALIKEAASSGAAWRIEETDHVLDVNLGRVIGTDQAGVATSALRIVAKADGSVTTAYPISWP